LWGVPPKLDMEREKAVQAATREVVVGGLARAAHDLGEGGIAVALAEASLGGVGAEVSFESGLRPEIALYHEGPSRVLIATERRAEVEAIAARHGVEALWIGRTVEGLLKIRLNSHEVISVSTDKLHHRWDRALEEALHV